MPAGMLGRLFALTALVAAPGIVAIGVLAAMSDWRPGAVALAILFVIACAALVVAVYLRDLAALARYVGGLGPSAATDRESPPRVVGEAGRLLAAMIARLQNRWRRHDRTQARRLEDARSIMEAIGDPLLLLTANRVVANANSAALSLFGAGSKGRDLASVLRHPDVLAAVDAVLAGGAPETISYSTPVPVERVYQADISAFKPGDGDSAVLVSLHDITKIKRSEQMRGDNRTWRPGTEQTHARDLG